jgi:F420-non-reducing hydrogenase iron-sulfur subunit
MGEPMIAMFVCRTARTALAGPDGIESVPPGVQVIELPCSGRVDEVMVLRALRQGVWASLIVGCLDGNCRNRTGTYQARKRVDEVRSLLEQLGLGPERVRMISVASNQHGVLMDAIERARADARRLGPVKILEGDR